MALPSLPSNVCGECASCKLKQSFDVAGASLHVPSRGVSILSQNSAVPGCKLPFYTVVSCSGTFLVQLGRQTEQACCPYRTAAGLESGRQTSLETQGAMSGLPHCEEADEPCAKGGRPGRSVLSHVATEQRRRDKINEGCVPFSVCSSSLNPSLAMSASCHCCSLGCLDFCSFLALRELIPHKDKMDKATFLQQAVEYIRQLQVCSLLC